MIELLTRLNTKSSSFSQDQAEYTNTSQLCPECSSRSRKAVAEAGGCKRCGGTRRLAVTSAQNQTRGNSDVLFTPQYISALLAGLPQHKQDAALAHVISDSQAITRLMAYMIDNVISVAAHEWKLDDHTKNVRMAGIAATSVYDLTEYPKKIQTKYACALVGCKPTQWKTLWRDRSEICFTRMYGWVGETGSHMYLRHEGPREKTG